MSVRRIAFALVLLSLPAIATAQRGGSSARGGDGRGTKSPNWDELARGVPTTLVSRKDLEAMDPVRHLIDNKKDLKFSEAQLAQLKSLLDQSKTRDESLFESMDSLRKEMKPKGTVDDVERLRQQAVRREFAATVAKVRANYDVAAKEVLPTLDEAQRPTAAELLAKQKEEADELVMKQLGGGPRGGSRPGGGGTRPPGSA